MSDNVSHLPLEEKDQIIGQSIPASTPLAADDKKKDGDDETSSAEAKRWILGRALAGELLCTFIFLYIAMAVPWNMNRLKVDNPNTEAVAVAFNGVSNIYSFADISGAHFNPAVTFTTVMTGKTTWRKGFAYMLAQLLGSVFASAWFIVTFPDGVAQISNLALKPDQSMNKFYQVMMEFTLTFILVYVIFSVAFDTVDSNKVEVKQVGNTANKGAKSVQAKALTIYTASGTSKAGFAPLSIGFTLGLLSLVGGSVSGGAYNPARAFGPALVSGVWQDQWIYWIGDFAGAFCAGHAQLFFQRLKKYAGTK